MLRDRAGIALMQNWKKREASPEMGMTASRSCGAIATPSLVPRPWRKPAGGSRKQPNHC